MDKYFPLYFNKSKTEIIRGLSVSEYSRCKDDSVVYLNPKLIPNRNIEKKMTLVWDLDQTLISADGIEDENENDLDTKLVIRPYAREILNILKRNASVEFIIWTAGTESHAKRVVCSFPYFKFDYVISRDKCWYHPTNPVKNLNLITNDNRALSSIILIDDRMDIGTKHPENLLVVPPYYPKKQHAGDDSTLLYLVNILQKAIDEFDENHNFSSYLFSPLTEKCVYEDNHYYFGVKCFEKREDIEDRIRCFEKML